MEDFKSNSIALKETPSPENSKAITTGVVAKKGSEASKIGKKFFSEDAKTVGGHVMDSVIIPSLQKLLSDSVKGAIDWLIYGKKGSSTKSGVGTISYGKYYSANGMVSPSPLYANPMINNNNVPRLYQVNDIIIQDRGDAEEVLLRLKEIIETYGMASVADFYELVNQRPQYTDQKWGWFDLKTAEVLRVDGGFSIRFPVIQQIEK